jgi:hypothetical protein
VGARRREDGVQCERHKKKREGAILLWFQMMNLD